MKKYNCWICEKEVYSTLPPVVKNSEVYKTIESDGIISVNSPESIITSILNSRAGMVTSQTRIFQES